MSASGSSAEPTPHAGNDDPEAEVPRRTWLAAERTWLAWWRTGLASAAVALGVGRLLPAVTHGVRWPYRVLGVAYALLAVAILVVGARRQRLVSRALHRGSYEELSSPLVMCLTAIAVVLSVSVVALIGVGSY